MLSFTIKLSSEQEITAAVLSDRGRSFVAFIILHIYKNSTGTCFAGMTNVS